MLEKDSLVQELRSHVQLTKTLNNTNVNIAYNDASNCDGEDSDSRENAFSKKQTLFSQLIASQIKMVKTEEMMAAI